MDLFFKDKVAKPKVAARNNNRFGAAAARVNAAAAKRVNMTVAAPAPMGAPPSYHHENNSVFNPNMSNRNLMRKTDNLFKKTHSFGIQSIGSIVQSYANSGNEARAKNAYKSFKNFNKTSKKLIKIGKKRKTRRNRH